MGDDHFAMGISQQIKGFGPLRLACDDSRAGGSLNEPETPKASRNLGKQRVKKRARLSERGDFQ
jgi:hypothetical protein